MANGEAAPPCMEPEPQVEKNDLKKKLRFVFARAPGAITGAFYVSSLSWDQTFKVTAIAMLAGYHIFFWFGPKIFYSPASTIDEENEKKLEEICEEKHGATTLLDQLKELEEICEEKHGATSLLDQLKEAIRVLRSERLLPLWLTFTFTCNLVSATGNTFFIAQVSYLVKNTKESSRIFESTF
ncbi:hypothetical protein SLE2022_329250 [Rubroshorea leprosula]